MAEQEPEREYRQEKSAADEVLAGCEDCEPWKGEAVALTTPEWIYHEHCGDLCEQDHDTAVACDTGTPPSSMCPHESLAFDCAPITSEVPGEDRYACVHLINTLAARERENEAALKNPRKSVKSRSKRTRAAYNQLTHCMECNGRTPKFRQRFPSS